MSVIVIANLTMALTSESLTGMVYQPITIGWPSGLAHMVVDALFNKYTPQNILSKIELHRSLNTVITNKKEYPTNLSEAISDTNKKYNTATYQWPKEDKIATVMNNAPEEYSTVFTCEQRVKGSALKIEYLQEAMSQLYGTIYFNKVNEDADTDIGLARNHGSKIICYLFKK